MARLPLDGVRVLDFSTLLPGPLATLILAEAGADVIKIERPGGEDLRRYPPMIDEDESAYFVMLNRGKRAYSANLKDAGDRDRILAMAAGCDVLVEQFRPGVMARLGLGYEDLRKINPRLVYCSISGFGQAGARSLEPAHDLNYLALGGMLSLTGDDDGAPVLPHVPVADIGGGTFPALVNILLALRLAEATGRGEWLDIAMAENAFCWQPWVMAQQEAGQGWPEAGRGLMSGGSPRYMIYRTADDRYLAAAPLEEHFWGNFCNAIDLHPALRDDSIDPGATIAGVAAQIAGRPAADWVALFSGRDVCCTLVAPPDEARRDPDFAARGVFARRVRAGEHTLAALPMPLARSLRRPEAVVPGAPPPRPIDELAAPVWRQRKPAGSAMPHD